MITMNKTTGELKHWLTPDNLIKAIAIIFVVISVLTLSIVGILDGSTTGAILSVVLGYSLGSNLKINNEK
jgi:hypothetical protein